MLFGRAVELGEERWIGKRGSYSALAHLSLFGLAIAVPLLLLLAALLLQSANAEREQLERQVSQVRDSLVNNVDRDLDRDITILRTLATSRALARQDWRAFYNEAQAGLQGRAYLVLVDAQGRQLVNTYVPYGTQPAKTGDPETVRRMARTKAPVVSNLFVSLVVKKPVFNVSIPILEHGRLRYVMSLGLLPETLVALLASQRLAPEWITTIWDAHGIIMARSRQSARYVGTRLPQNLRERRVTAALRTTNLDGVDVLHAAARSSVANWGIGVNIPYASIARQTGQSLLVWGIAAIAAIAIAFILGLFFARQITASLAAASRAAAAFADGEEFRISGSRLKEADAFLTTLKSAQQQLSRAQGHQKLLMRELQHRTQNLFVVIQALISRSLREGQTVANARQVIMGRLDALARTQDILAGAAWEGAPLQDILRREFSGDLSNSIEIGGCDVVINAAAAHQFALIVHELTTNALKYGALSVPGGRVSVAGTVAQKSGAARFSLLWREHDGPPVTTPARRGFGSVILFDAAKQFGMEIKMDYDPTGLRYELHVPMSHIAPSALPGSAAAA